MHKLLCDKAMKSFRRSTATTHGATGDRGASMGALRRPHCFDPVDLETIDRVNEAT